MDPQLRDIRIVDSTGYSYVYEQHVTVPLKSGGVIRCNVYRPRESKNGQKFPVIATLGPYGKDVPYKVYVSLLHPNLFTKMLSIGLIQTALQKLTQLIKPSIPRGKPLHQSIGLITAMSSSEATNPVLGSLRGF